MTPEEELILNTIIPNDGNLTPEVKAAVRTVLMEIVHWKVQARLLAKTCDSLTAHQKTQDNIIRDQNKQIAELKLQITKLEYEGGQ